jgi:hypothetical protein
MVRLDIVYAKNQSLWLDAKIVFKTIPAIVRQIIDTMDARRAESRSRPASVTPISVQNTSETPKAVLSCKAS